MGMYDYLVCRCPLPGIPPFAANQQYQSKSLDCEMAEYEIGDDGKLRQCGRGAFQTEFDSAPIPFDGVLEFYHSNWAVAAYGMTFTPGGEDYESVTYEATFVDGRVQQIVETEREHKQALSREVYQQVNTMFEDDKPTIIETAPEIGAEMYVLWGSIDRSLDGYPVKLVAKTSRDWAFAGPDDRIETIHPAQLGNCLFHSEADAKAQRRWEHQLWDRQTEYCNELLQTKKQESLDGIGAILD
jgi:hypothetical protein